MVGTKPENFENLKMFSKASDYFSFGSISIHKFIHVNNPKLSDET